MAIMKSKQKPGFAAGIYSDMTLDGPEIGTLVAVVDRAKNLPNRRAIGKQDPYCAMRLAKDAKKTNTDKRGGQTPRWDQELRFTVHDSPDYYKLKVSIFNDDKKTELIGEAWIDLTNVVKLGGGQSDQWHQLNFKGKYAGEIRVELTFYDTREQPQEKKKKDRAQSTPTESGSDLSLPASRSLGPREIKRRPLPVSPAEAAAPRAPAQVETPPQKTPAQQQQQQLEPVYAPVPLRPRTRSASPLPEQQPQYDDYSHIQQQDFAQPEFQPQPQKAQRPQSQRVERQQPWQQPLGSEYRQSQREPSREPCDLYQNYQDQQTELLPAATRPTSAYPDEQEIWQLQRQSQQQRPQPVHFYSDPVTPQHDFPTNRPTPPAMSSDTQLVRHRHHQSDVSQYEASYIESPLRQSVQGEQLYNTSHSDVPPPLPPKHRETPPKRQRNEFPPTSYTSSAYIPQPLRVGHGRSSVSDRSPLQALEDGYGFERHAHPQYDLPTPKRNSGYDSPQYPPQTPDQQLELYGRRSTYNMPPAASDPQLPRQRPAGQPRRSSYEIRHPSFTQQQLVDEPQPMTPQDTYHSGQDAGYQPSVEDAPPSPGIQPIVVRKAIGDKAKKLNNVPFGPDAYDVLNPASSPVTNDRTPYQTPDQAKEAARFREVEKLRDLGPIIGNDGREIDPSDHLPVDTWAPEPEPRNRPPEHVIHIRSKNDPNRPSGARAAPLVIHNRGGSRTTVQTGMPSSLQAVGSPAARTAPSSFVGGRNRLQKPIPAQAREQPYSSPVTAAASSPALASSPHEMSMEGRSQSGRPLHPRRPSYENRLSNHVVRPALSEYQVPAGNSYIPRQNSYDPYASPLKAIEHKPYEATPTKQQHTGNYSSPYVESDRRSSYDNRSHSYERRNSYDNRSDYSYENHMDQYHQDQQRQPQQPQQQRNYYDDPLAAEMSLIDIGPSRNSYQQGSTGRSVARRW